MTDGDVLSYSQGLRRLAAAASINVIASIATAIAGVLATAVMARYLPVDYFGRVLLLLTAVNAFAIFEGLRPVIIHLVASGSDAPEHLFRAAARVNVLMASATMLCVVSASIFGFAPSLFSFTGIALVATVIAFFYTMQYWAFLDAEADTNFTSIVRASCWTVLYLSFAALSVVRTGLVGYAISLFLMNMSLAVIYKWRFGGLGLAARYSPLDRSNTTSPQINLLGPAFNNIMFNCSAVTINVADRAVVGNFLGAHAAGLYAGPSELALRAVGLVRAAMQVALPWAVRLSDGNQQRLWFASTSALLLVVGSCCVGVLYARETLASFVLGEAFRTTGDLLGLFSIGILLSAMGYSCIVQLNARGDFQTQRRLYMVAAAVLVLGAILGAMQGSLVLIACAFLLSRSVDLVLLVLILGNCPGRDQLRFMLMGAAMSLALLAAWHNLGAPALVALATSVCIAYFPGCNGWGRPE